MSSRLLEKIRSQEALNHLLQEELSGMREMLAGETQALAGAQRAYAAAAQRADLLEEQLKYERTKRSQR